MTCIIANDPKCPIELWDGSKPAFTCSGSGEVTVDALWEQQNKVIHLAYDLPREKWGTSWDELDPWSYAFFRGEYIRSQHCMRTTYHRNIGVHFSSEESLPLSIKNKRDACLRIMGALIVTVDRMTFSGSYFNKSSIEYISTVTNIEKIADEHLRMSLIREEAKSRKNAMKTKERAESKRVLNEEHSRLVEGLEAAISRAKSEGAIIPLRLNGMINNLMNRKSTSKATHDLVKTATAQVIACIPVAKTSTGAASKEQEKVIDYLKKSLDTAIEMEVTVRIDKKRFYLDGLLEHKGLKVAIEYDGSYWHGSAEAYQKDIIKSLYLINNGYLLVRIRDEKLPPLPLDDSRLLSIDDFIQQEICPSKRFDQLRSLSERVQSFIDMHKVEGKLDKNLKLVA
jgi:hypothetical protein